MINTVIIDENKEQIEQLKIQLKKYCPEINVISVATTADDGIHLIKRYNPELVFLGTEIGYMTGFQLLKKFPNQSFGIVFISDDGRYAAEAFNYNTIHYLLKPVNGDKLKTVADRFNQCLHRRIFISMEP